MGSLSQPERDKRREERSKELTGKVAPPRFWCINNNFPGKEDRGRVSQAEHSMNKG